jgi:hypothetical protein
MTWHYLDYRFKTASRSLMTGGEATMKSTF